MRLAFAVAAHLEPEILLVDEVLAVGDAAFQRKSLAKMAEVARAGSTVIFVSHNLATIQALCQRGDPARARQRRRRRPGRGGGRPATCGRSSAPPATTCSTRTDRDGRAWEETLVSRLAVYDGDSGERRRRRRRPRAPRSSSR